MRAILSSNDTGGTRVSSYQCITLIKYAFNKSSPRDNGHPISNNYTAVGPVWHFRVHFYRPTNTRVDQ